MRLDCHSLARKWQRVRLYPSDGTGRRRTAQIGEVTSTPWAPTDAAFQALDTARGLQYLHSREPPVCHADIKPVLIAGRQDFVWLIVPQENTLVDNAGNARLCDFGLARMLEDEPSGLTTTDRPKYTLFYASPELLHDGTRHTLKSDVWAWGCLFLGVRLFL